ncbi:strawberry notch-like NTP hydrolase domain-containing protein [Neopusillimonas maritima]|uniref:Helicase ATP-binding domain-containing protein n=1 Tax=Neopusillimonas maritima TaxID=2026239 RepID=A0A3A1YU75_9BURK|nr:strawberry notch family protein [Neopusillimonas maritima]RIY41071.1 hypothetical protein CJP73_07945 [Neopusillimonas maritima]
MSDRKQRWINLNDSNGAQLKIMPYNKGAAHYLVISGVAPKSELFQQLINQAGFVASSSGVLLVRKVKRGELVNAEQFRPFWPQASAELMSPKAFILPDPTIVKAKPQQEDTTEQEQAQAQQAQDIASLIQSATYLGYNASGDKVYERPAGRFIVAGEQAVFEESQEMPRPMFLRCRTNTDLRQAVAGFLMAVEKGESLRETDLARFVSAIWAKDVEQLTAEQWINLASNVDTQLAANLLNNATTAPSAWGDALYFEQMIACLPQIRSQAKAYTGSMPLAILTQRLLGAFGQNDVLQVEGAVNPLTFGLNEQQAKLANNLPNQVTSYWQKAALRFEPAGQDESDPVEPVTHLVAEIELDESTQDKLVQLSTQLDQDATAVFQLRLNSEPGQLDSKTKNLLLALENIGVIEQVFDMPQRLLRDGRDDQGVRLILFRKTNTHLRREYSQKQLLAVAQSWDVAKTITDETLVRLQRPDDGTDESISLDYLTRAENKLQRPYLAMSRIGPSSTMVPKNIQSSLGYALSNLEQEYGHIDDYVRGELGIGSEFLSESFSPEQIDAIGLILRRFLDQKGFILGDETGIGKGRTIAAAITWALKNNYPVIFFTDKSTLFSDLARDLKDIGEWDRVKPLITNADGNILDIGNDGQVLASATPPKALTSMIEKDEPFWKYGANIVFTTYSQLNQENSAKGAWLARHCKNAIVVTDEAHIAAGSDSNIAENLYQITQSAAAVLYSSATWAKNARNLRLYARAFPDNLSTVVLSDLITRGGQDFSEIFSGMLAMDGAFIRREHDLSKIDFEVVIDEPRKERNEGLVGQVSEILGLMTMLSGDIKHALQRINLDTQQVITEASDAYRAIRTMVGAASASELSTIAKARKTQIEEGIRALEQAREQAATQGSSQIPLAYEYVMPDEQASEAADRHNSEVNELRQAGLVATDQAQLVTLERINEWLSMARNDVQTITNFENSQLKLARTVSNNGAHLFKSSFGTGSAIYQSMRRTMAALLVDAAVERAVTAVQEGRKPVIVFEETGESFVNRLIEQEIDTIQDQIKQSQSPSADRLTKALADQLAKNARKDNLVDDIRMPVLGDMMRNLLTKVGGVEVKEPDSEVSLKNADTKRIRAIRQLKDVPGVGAELVERYEKGLAEISAKIDALPEMPIVTVDAIRTKLAQAGINSREISGRTYQLDPIEGQGNRARLSRRDRSKAAIMKSVSDFNNTNDTHALIINIAAATGLSMHSSPRFKNTSQRELIEFQIPEDPIVRVQLLGRVNRFDQLIPPQISTLATGLFAEYRSLMMQNKKLQDLSANIRSSRDNAAVIDTVSDILNPMGDRVAHEFLMENPGIAARLDIPLTRLQMTTGMASLLTQRLVLLAPNAQRAVYDEVLEAYSDALIEKQLEDGGQDSYDWRAKTVSTYKAWGPPQELAIDTAFDSPVNFNMVEYTEDYQPIQWEQMRAQIAQSSTELLEDERITKAPTIGVKKLNTARATQLHDSPANAFVKQLLSAIEQEKSSLAATQNLSQQSDALIAGKWLSIKALNSSNHELQAFAVLVSKSGKSAYLYNVHRGRATQYYLDIERAKNNVDNPELHSSLKSVRKFKCDKDHWVDRQFNACWGSIDPDIDLVEFQGIVDKADRVFEAKKVMALSDSEFDSIDEALISSIENSVQIIYKRQLFLKEILPSLVPGTLLSFTNADNGFYFWQDKALIVGVDLPPINRESSLSKWKFHIVRAGETRIQSLSASSLLKMTDFKVHLDTNEQNEQTFTTRCSINSAQNVINRFMGESYLNELKNSIQMYTPGPRVRRHSILSGNMFEAEQWARATKMGRPIIYSDEHGAKHRAIEIKRSLFGTRQSLNGIEFPVRLSESRLISAFFKRCREHFELTAQQGNGNALYALSTTFKSAVDLNRNNEIKSDLLVYNPQRHVLTMELSKAEKDRAVRMMRQAFAKDKAKWCDERNENPNDDSCTYPLKLTTRSQRTPAGQTTTYVGIALPTEPEQQDRFLKVLSDGLGLQLYVPRNHYRVANIAREVEQVHYEQLGQELLQRREQRLQAAARRKEMLETLEKAFDDRASDEDEPDDLAIADLALDPLVDDRSQSERQCG